MNVSTFLPLLRASLGNNMLWKINRNMYYIKILSKLCKEPAYQTKGYVDTFNCSNNNEGKRPNLVNFQFLVVEQPQWKHQIYNQQSNNHFDAPNPEVSPQKRQQKELYVGMHFGEKKLQIMLETQPPKYPLTNDM